MTIKDHHLLCIGVLAKIGIQAASQNDPTCIIESDLKAIREAIQSAKNLGLPVDVSRFDKGLPIHRVAALEDREP